MDQTRTVFRVVNGVLQAVEVPRPKTPPRDCGFSNEQLECLGCGAKLGCIKSGHCYAIEGESAYKT
ncbi:MAG: hypothetical protein Q8P76_02825 [bacterium]|nr:hypothetical protein [bacterium]